MRYRTLATTGTIVSNIALGTMGFGTETEEAEAFAILDRFIEADGNLIDTANVYGAGASEELLGRWFASRPAELTERVVLATKARFGTGPDVNENGSSRRNLDRALTASLKRLGREKVDLYQLHGWDPLTPIEETLGFLDAAVHAGRINYIGLSNFTGWQMQLTLDTAKAMGLQVPVTLQPQYSLLVRDIEHEVVPAALDAGIGLLPWSPLGGGWLTGKYKRNTAPKGASRLGENPQRGMEAWEARNADPRTWAVLDAVKAVAQAHEASASQVALAWLLARPAVTSVILGARSVDQLQDNIGASDLRLSDDEITRLTEASAPRVDDYPYGAAGVEQRGRKIAGGR